MKRRGLIATSIGLVVLLIGALGVGLATSGVDDPSDGPAVSLADLKEQRVIRVEMRQDIYVVYDEGEVRALSADAQHVGDDVEFCASSQLFESPAHGEKFDIRGFYYAGPGQRGLERYRTRVEGDGVFIDFEHPIEGAERGAGPPRDPAGPFCIPS
jgi:nitrite reductase/ring-hydroxylating ferredoxin subunit